MGRAIGILMLIGLAALVVFFSIPLREVPYFEPQSLKYKAISSIERGQPGGTIKRVIGGFVQDEEYIIPYSFPIGRIIIKNAEITTPEQLAFSEDDEVRLTSLIEQYEKIKPVYGQHLSLRGWEQKPLWERAGRRIIAAIPLSSAWRRYIPAFKYGIIPEDGQALMLQVTGEMAALKSKREANSPALFEAHVTFHASGQTYSRQDGTGLIPGAVGTIEFRIYEINMDEDKWSWEYEVRPDVKWATRYKKVTLFSYLIHALESP